MTVKSIIKGDTFSGGVDDADGWGNTALHQAALHNSRKVAIELLAHKAKANARNRQGNTPLHLTTIWNSNKVAKELLEYGGASANAKNNRGETPLHWAVKWNAGDVAQTLLDHGAAVNVKDSVDGRTPVDALCGSGEDNCQPKDEALFSAVGHRDVQKVKIWLAMGADPNARTDESRVENRLDWSFDPDGIETSLLLAIRQGDSEDIVEALIAAGVDVNTASNDGDTALKMAVLSGQLGTAEKLLEAGADVNAKDSYGSSPLHLAACRESSRMVELLLNHGADLDSRTRNNESVLLGALVSGYSQNARALVQHGADCSLDANANQDMDESLRDAYPDLIRDFLMSNPDLRRTCRP